MRVLITSDEVDPAWWADIERRGWSYFDWSSPEWVILEDPQYRIHEAWWPTLIDAACQSMAAGFVGTEGSTMSLLALKRVREWNGGVGVLVSIGPLAIEALLRLSLLSLSIDVPRRLFTDCTSFLVR